jgi:hypothetical protein
MSAKMGVYLKTGKNHKTVGKSREKWDNRKLGEFYYFQIISTLS